MSSKDTYFFLYIIGDIKKEGDKYSSPSQYDCFIKKLPTVA